MSESKRIEGQMFRSAGMRWGVAVVLLVLAAGGVMVVGYALRAWSAYTAAIGAGGMAGGAGGGAAGGWVAGGAGGTTVFGPPVKKYIGVGTVPWPVGPKASFRERWLDRQPGIGSGFVTYYVLTGGSSWRAQGAEWMAIPVAGEDQFVLVVHVPTGVAPPLATEGQLWVCPMYADGIGGYHPDLDAVHMVVELDEAKFKRMWEDDLPAGLAADLIAAGKRSSPTASYMQRAPFDLEKYFKDDGAAAEDDEEEREGL